MDDLGHFQCDGQKQNKTINKIHPCFGLVKPVINMCEMYEVHATNDEKISQKGHCYVLLYEETLVFFVIKQHFQMLLVW